MFLPGLPRGEGIGVPGTGTSGHIAAAMFAEPASALGPVHPVAAPPGATAAGRREAAGAGARPPACRQPAQGVTQPTQRVTAGPSSPLRHESI